MTAEELALLGYPATQQDQSTAPAITGGDLSALNAPVGSAPIQPGNAMAAPGIDAASLAAMSGPVPSPVTESMYPDQAGYPISQTTPQPTSGTGPDGSVAMGDPSVAAQRQQQPQLTPWQQYLTERGIGPNSVVDMASHRELLKGFNAMQLKQLELQDPEKKLKLQQMQYDISTQGMKDQNLQAQTAESQSKVIAGELAKQQAQDTVSNQIADLQTQKDNLQSIANHPELKNMTGLAGQYNPGINDQQRDLKARLEQVSGQQLIGGINKIKDEAANPNGTLGMRITQQEAVAVKNAVQRLQRYQDPATFASSANEAAGFLDKAITAKQAQLARMPSVNQNLLKQFSYSPASSVTAASTSSPANSAAPIIKTIPGRGTFQSLGNGQWKQIQ
jgi:hypothetical protein